MGTASRPVRFQLTIPSGSTTSNIAWGWATFGSSAGMDIYSPASLSETVKIQVCSDPVKPTSASTWVDWTDGDPQAVMAVPAAGTAAPYHSLVTVGAIRLVSSTTVGADRVFDFTCQGTF